MKSVQIVSGGYGYREKENSPTRLVLAGEIISLPEDEADRLVKIGAAEEVLAGAFIDLTEEEAATVENAPEVETPPAAKTSRRKKASA